MNEHATIPTCPPLHALEAIARGETQNGLHAAHLEHCATCRAALDEIRRNNALLRELSRIRPAGAERRVARAPTPPIKGYDIIEVIARGGQGTVYEGVQKATKRRVALKVLSGGRFATSRQRNRFEREAELAAGLRHPNIVTVFDRGTTDDGRLYCVMEFVEGAPLDRYLIEATMSGGKRSIAGVLRLFVKICAAVEHAHQRGIIHRDLKPANILIDRSCEPRIVDFGLAKLTGVEADLTVTQEGEFAGTFAYASPEQTLARPEMIDTRSDVYSLGVLAYEALTGRMPYRTSGPPGDVLRAIAQDAPARPSSVRGDIDGEVETILLKALAKEPDRRYQSAGQLARDFEHYLGGEPIDAKRDSTWYVLRKTVRRHRLPFALAAIAVALLAGFAVAMSVAYRRTRAAEQVAAARSTELAERLAESNIERGRALGMAGNTLLAEELLWREKFAEEGRVGSNGELAPARWALWELYSRQPCLASFTIPGSDIGLAKVLPDGRTVALSRRNSPAALELWDVQSRALRMTLHGEKAVTEAGCDRDATILGAGYADGELRLWDLRSGRLLATGKLGTSVVSRVAVSSQRRLLAAGDAAGKVSILELPALRELVSLSPQADRICCLAFSPGCEWLAIIDEGGSHQVRDAKSGALVAEWAAGGYRDSSAQFSSTGDLLAMSDFRIGLQFCRVPSFELAGALSITYGVSHSMDFSRDGSTLAVSFDDQTIRAWNMADHRLIRTITGHTGEVHIGFDAKSDRLLSYGLLDRTMRAWDCRPEPCRRSWEGHTDSVLSACYSPDGALLASGSGDSTIRIWDPTADPPRCVRVLKAESTVHGVALSSGGLVASGEGSGAIRVWDARTGKQVRALRKEGARVHSVAFSPDGGILASTDTARTLKLWNPRDGRCMHDLSDIRDQYSKVCFSPDGRFVAAGGKEQFAVYIWDVGTGKLRNKLTGHNATIRCVCYSSDGRVLASGADDHTIRLWDVASGQCLGILKGHLQKIFGVSFRGDGQLLASCGTGGEIKLWNVPLRRCLATLSGSNVMVFGVQLSSDGKQLTSWAGDHNVTIWDLECGNQYLAGNERYWAERLGPVASD